ncbi:MAG: hypothetical protein D8M61_00195 [Ignavibacteriae bacterium]|nr:hypothetical protein [Ignavibacteriota bacterium]
MNTLKYSITTFLFLVLLFSISIAQRKSEEKNFGIDFSGFVKTDLMFDSRQTVSAREGHLLLFPTPEVLDAKGEDINAKANLNMLSIQTRLKGSITAPDAFGAKINGVIEGAFFGHSNGDVNGFRLRHAFVKLTWDKCNLLIGQYWNPMFITEVFPGTISFNTGVPFQPFSRNPQIKFTRVLNDVHVGLTAFTQRDFTSTGPNGASSIYLRNSAIPTVDLNIKYVNKNFVAGVGGNFKSLLPKTSTLAIAGVDSGKSFKSDERINSIAFMGFLKVVSDLFTFKAEGIYGGNMTDLLMLGGYAVKSLDVNTGIEEYTSIKTLSAWTEFIYGSKFQVGLFAGYTKNLGADDNIAGSVYSRGSNIESIIRVSPRAQYSAGKTRFACEVEFTSAMYGVADVKGKVENSEAVSNLRLLVAAFLFF